MTTKKPKLSFTPVERYEKIWVKRDDTFSIAGVYGGKARSCWHLAQGATGLITAGSRSSPQVNIVAHIAKEMGIPCRCHTPMGELLPELISAKAAGAEIIQHKPGHNSVIVARAREDAKKLGWREIPFGMECAEAVEQTANQINNLPSGVKRIVVPVGSGMSLAGILVGLQKAKKAIPVLGIKVGANPIKRLNKFAPVDWEKLCTLVDSGVPYSEQIEPDFPIKLDPIYEAKCVQFLKPNDLLWIVGIRQSALDVPSKSSSHKKSTTVKAQSGGQNKMGKFVAPHKPSETAKRFIKSIRTSWIAALDNIIEVGKTLHEAQEKLDPNDWIGMITHDLPFTRRTAEKLVKIAMDQRITNPKNADYLPPHWTSLHELTYLTDKQFAAGIKAKVIHPDAERKDISNLKTKKKPKQKKQSSAPSQPNKSSPSEGQSLSTYAAMIQSQDDNRYPDENSAGGLSIAEISAEKELTQEEFDKVQDALINICRTYNLQLSLAKSFKHQSLLFEVEGVIKQRKQDLEGDSRGIDAKQVTDVFFQFETGNNLRVNEDGSFHKNDLRHSKNPFQNFDKEQLYGYCQEIGIITQYTPIEFLDAQLFVDTLTWRYLSGNQKQRDAAMETLEQLSVVETKGKKFQNMKVSRNQLHLFTASRRVALLNE